MSNYRYNAIMAILVLSIITILHAENYISTEIACIPWGEEIHHLGYISGGITYGGTQGEMIWPGFGPKSWDVDTAGNIYITDFVKSRIAVYDKDGEFQRDIGVWYESDNSITINGTSGRTYYLVRQHRFNNKNRNTKDNVFVFIKEMGDVAVDNMGNVYVTEYPSGTKLFKFSSDGKLVKIVDVFGRYEQNDIREIGFDVRSNQYGHIIVGIMTNQNKRVFLQFDENEEVEFITEDKIAYQDDNRNTYDYMKYRMQDTTYSCVKLSVLNFDSTSHKTLAIFLNTPTCDDIIFKGVDGIGNIYLRVDSVMLKYDHHGNLLGRIQMSVDKNRTFDLPMPSLASVSKVMSNGDVYDAYMSDQGFVVVKHELQQETKGRILEPAYIPEDIKKEKE